MQTKELHLLLIFIFCITEHYLETLCTVHVQRKGGGSCQHLSFPFFLSLQQEHHSSWKPKYICLEMLSSHEDE